MRAGRCRKARKEGGCAQQYLGCGQHCKGQWSRELSPLGGMRPCDCWELQANVARVGTLSSQAEEGEDAIISYCGFGDTLAPMA
jgi:hypothetical protein